MEVFNIVKDWITANMDLVITNSIVGIVVASFFKTISTLYKNTPKVIKILAKIKGIKYLGFIFLYALPLGTIGAMIILQTTEPTFKNIALFIIICITFIFNILINRISSIYKMISELTSKTSENDLVHKKAINIIFEKIDLKERLK
ncbi:hypothetical protein [Tenacibaculum piscium]|uniref:hypothetical protein n=1 Tax=Tenacibaculum piscium TaxID=1458515 RepID=UPI00187B1D60|nr:hypothetical protein [Tenacibaculum piscium]MBE7630492.1 hypothetical protein [Tenacibaculum piscium]MBE7670956.1 hypothetical protein [Tenacibaculum piscium]